ncbi:beta-galactosidase [bacterium]|nr:beta-galactosidase [bacterium]
MPTRIAMITTLLLGFGAAGECGAHLRGVPREALGVWTWTKKAKITRAEYPYVKGCPIVEWWAALEPEPGKFDFSRLDRRIQEAVADGMHCFIAINVGQCSPKWLFDQGVPRVHLKGKPHDDWNTYPYYFDATHVAAYYRFIRMLGAHLRALPAELRARILVVNAAEGSTGDPYCYKGTPEDAKYAISRQDWAEYRLRAWAVFHEAFRGGDAPVLLLSYNHLNLEVAGVGARQRDWIVANHDVLWFKMGVWSHGYQHNFLRDRLDEWRKDWGPYVLGKDGKSVAAYGEMDREWLTVPAFHKHAETNFYWTALSALTKGLNIWLVRTDALESKRFEAALRFFDHYAPWAGGWDPAGSPGAWCALRDGLDASDAERFPEVEYGKVSQKNRERYTAIAKAFADRGAVIGDLDAAAHNYWGSRHGKAMNDVNWRIPDGNYALYLRQIEPRKTSVGWWSAGPADQPYGRFARGTNTAMRFDLDDGFFGAERGKAKRVRIRVVYLDRGAGSWRLAYHAVGAPAKTAAPVSLTDTGRWKETVVDIDDALLENGGPQGSDLSLVVDEGKGHVFHLVELTRVTD